MKYWVDFPWHVKLDIVGGDHFEDCELPVLPVQLPAGSVIREVVSQLQPDHVADAELWCFLTMAVGLKFLCLLCLRHLGLHEVDRLGELVYHGDSCFRRGSCISVEQLSC